MFEQLEQLEEVRRRLFDSLDAVDGPESAAAFQRELADAIMHAEELKSAASIRSERGQLGYHKQMCRSYGDAMVWNLLHRHTIRQLAGAEGKPPHLTGMASIVDRYMDFIEAMARVDTFAFAPDLTNIIKVADVVVVSNHEAPVLVEIKGEKYYMTLPGASPGEQNEGPAGFGEVGGRLGRQLGKMEEVTEYLTTGSVKPSAGPIEKRVLEVDTVLDHYWREVEEAVEGALDHGDHVVVVSGKQRIWATTAEPGSLNPPAEFLHGIPKDTPFRVGRHLVPLEQASPFVMPPFNWDMSARCRFALMEGTVVVTHMVDLSVLEGRSYENARIIEAGVSDPDLGTDAVLIDVDGEVVRMSSMHAFKMIYEFQSVETVAEFMLRSAISAIELGREYEVDQLRNTAAEDGSQDV